MYGNDFPTETAAPIIVNERRKHRQDLSSAQLIKILRKRSTGKSYKKRTRTIDISRTPVP